MNFQGPTASGKPEVDKWLSTVASLFPDSCAVAWQSYDEGASPSETVVLANGARVAVSRQNEFQAGRIAAERALRRLGATEVKVGIAPDRSPVWPRDNVGSITHSGGLALAVVAQRREVASLGIDVERTGGATADLWPALFRSDEIEWLHSTPEDLKMTWSTLLFSAKEAFFKMQHPITGMWVDFTEAVVQVDSVHEAFLVHCFNKPACDALGRSDFRGRFSLNGRYVLTAMHVLAPTAPTTTSPR